MKKHSKKKYIPILFTGILLLILFAGMFLNIGVLYHALPSLSLADSGAAFVAAITDGFNGDIAGKSFFVNINGLTERLLGKRVLNDVVLLNNGHAGFCSANAPDEGIAANADSSKAFCDWLNRRDIDYLFVQVPYKNQPGNSQLPVGLTDYSNSIADRFLTELEARDVPYLDLRASIAEDNLDFYSLFLKTEHHWNAQGGFYAFQKICQYMQEHYGDEIDPMVLDLNNYHQVTCEKKSLGYYGSRTGSLFLQPEPFDLIYPKFETQQSCYIRHQDLTRSGSFYDAIFEMKYLNATETSGLYGTYIGGDYPVVLHESETAQTDKTLLLFIDSFGTIPESYLTTAYKHVYAIDLRWVKILGMPESAADFVEMYNPDHVIVAFNPNQIGGADSDQFNYGID